MSRLIPLSACATAVLLLSTTAAAASATALPTVDVEARHAVVRACPGIVDSLQRGLAAPAAHWGRRGLADVAMQLDGAGEVNVLHIDGPAVYQRHIRRVVERLDCHAPQAGVQRLRFAIRFG